MAKKAFRKIMAGLGDMRAHLDGDHGKGNAIASAPRLTDIDVARLCRDLDLRPQKTRKHG
jgi:hypothetical protein